MSWQLGAFSLLAVGLLGGFGWYERSRPDARIVALVGTLAAFAALGRIAFAAVPNVKPTTDIVLIAGFSLGGAPGYVVGAVAALSSNFFFGQGPWTPWQMAGWGVIGIAGALLARITRRRIGRFPLACLSFVLGFAFTALQDVGDWVTYSDHSLVQLGVFVGKGLGFDLLHASGCFGFAVLFGPGLISALSRFRARIQVDWLPRADSVASHIRSGAPLALTAGLVAALGAGVGMPSRASAAAPGRPAHHGSPIHYLLRAENPDGGFGMAPGVSSNTLATGWATLALADAGVSPRAVVSSAGRNPLQYLARTLRSERGAGDVERTTLAVAAAGRGFAGFAPLRRELRRLVGRDGSINQQTNLTAFGVLAMRAAGLRVPLRTIVWLAHQQDADGGFNFATRGGASDIDDTGAALTALAPFGRTPVTRRAAAFIRSRQNRDGGFGYQRGAASNAQSTAFAISGLIAAGAVPARLHRGGAPSPIQYLRSLIQPDGAVLYSRGNSQTPVWVTTQAEIALAGKTL